MLTNCMGSTGAGGAELAAGGVLAVPDALAVGSHAGCVLVGAADQEAEGAALPDAEGAALPDAEPAPTLTLTAGGGGLLPQATAGTAPVTANRARTTCDWLSFI
jgi:hypothetical protein